MLCFLFRTACVLLLLWMLPLVRLPAQVFAPHGARAVALGGASVALRDAGSAWDNPAACALVPAPTILMGWYMPFAISDLSLKSLLSVFRVAETSVGLSLRYYGYASYHELFPELALARNIASRWALGIRMGYFHRHISGGDRERGEIGGDVGLMGQISGSFTLGISMTNLTRVTGHKEDPYRIPTVMSIGVGYCVTPEILLSVQIRKDLEYAPLWCAGMEYQLPNKFFLRTGFSLGSVRNISFGFGLPWKCFHVDMACSYHMPLGWTPFITWTWQKVR